MWPWEHAIFAYVLYSLSCRLFGTRPSGRAVVGALVIGAVLPDLIDKPLAWQLGIFETGYAVGHSIFVAVPFSIVAILVAKHRNQLQVGIAFAYGYLSHLLGDLIPPLLREGEVPIERILWPIAHAPPSHDHGTFVDGVSHYLDVYQEVIIGGEFNLVILMQVAFAVLALGLWIADGYPGVRDGDRNLTKMTNRDP